MNSRFYIISTACLFILLFSNPTKSHAQSRKQKRNNNKEREQNKTYSKEANNLDVDMFLYHVDSINSQLYYSINSSQLVYKKDSSNNFTARIKVFYKFLPYADAKVFFDSSTVYIYDKVQGNPQTKIIAGYIPVRINVMQQSFLEIYIADANGKNHQTHFIKCDKQDAYAQQSYILLGNAGQVFFSNKIEKGQTINVYNARVTYNKARIDFFANDYSLPPPPFSDRSPLPYPSIPDSTFYISSFDGHNIQLQINKQGVYFIRLDSSANVSGCTVMGVEQYFPKVLSHTQMIAATRFIMSRDEYQKIITANDKQAAIENFWLTLGGGEDRAKELIKRYYNRVQDANTFFTSHIEGWKTDMGMIYIVFGPPNKTYKTQQMETWTYGTDGAPNSATFRFEKINNPFSENNFKLIRNSNYRDPWTIAVNAWREGHVYLEPK
ncbi:MAG: GWxTD domain-containing protein [Bacteroidia bacterium]